MQFIQATEADLPFIVDVYNSTIASGEVTADTNPVTVDARLQWFRQHNEQSRPLWIVLDENKQIGWVSFKDFYGRPAYNGTAEISIYLHESYRKRGLGKSILHHCITACEKLHIHTLLAFIFSHNHASIRLFTQCGFELWGSLPDVAVIDNKNISLSILGKKIK